MSSYEWFLELDLNIYELKGKILVYEGGYGKITCDF